MKTNAQSIRGTAANLLVASIVALTGAVHAQTPTVLYNFGTNSGDPLQPVPQAALTQGRDGNMYGTTQYGGAHGNGAVFKIDASGNTSVVYSFPSTPGAYYCVAGLVLGNDGNFYGVCVYGSTDKGSVYKVTPGGTRKVLHTFSGPDGDTPRAPLLLAADGNFYGTTTQGGANGFGTVYRMAPGGTLTTIYSFNSTDGANPVAPLIQATDGNLYGTTQNGGANGYGETFKITPAGKLTVLHLRFTMFRARESLDITVPIGTLATSAISLYDSPSISRSTNASRNAAGSSSIALPSSSAVIRWSSTVSGSAGPSSVWSSSSNGTASRPRFLPSHV